MKPRRTEGGVVETVFLCDLCGPFIHVDEDGCCVTCGADVIIVRRDYAEWVAQMAQEEAP